MTQGIIRLLAIASCLASLSACTFYVGGKDAGTREGEKAAQARTTAALRSA